MNRLQKEILDIYKEFKKVCDENNLRYFANGGTAIGAVRHQGFIPWDDDLDLMMPRPDYDAFLKIAEDRLPGHLKIINGEKHTDAYWMFAKVHNINTSFLDRMVLDANQPNNFWGIYIDIMTLDGIPDDIDPDTYFTEINHLLHQKCFHHDKEASRKFHDYVTRIPYDESNQIAKTSGRGVILEKEWLEGYVEVPFEDTTIRLCKGNSAFLERYIGDYMKLPPRSERTSPHEAFVDYSRPYTHYQAEYKNSGLIELLNKIISGYKEDAKTQNEEHLRLKQEVDRCNAEINNLKENLKQFDKAGYTARYLLHGIINKYRQPHARKTKE